MMRGVGHYWMIFLKKIFISYPKFKPFTFINVKLYVIKVNSLFYTYNIDYCSVNKIMDGDKNKICILMRQPVN